MDLPSILKERRDRLQLTQEHLADLADVSLATIKDIERGKANPSIATVEKIFTVLGLEIKVEVRKII